MGALPALQGDVVWSGDQHKERRWNCAKIRTRADRKKKREGENTEKQGEGRESRGPWKEGRRGRGCWERRREPLHEKAERSSKKALRAGVLSSTFSSAAVRVGSKTRWPPGASVSRGLGGA